MQGLIRPALRFLALIAFLYISSVVALGADPAVKWDPLRTTSPESVAELKALESQVKTVVDKVSPATVGLLVGGGVQSGAGSGVIVSEDGLILTAAHVIGRPNQNIKVILFDGTRVNAKTLGSHPKDGDKEVDSGMAIITDKPPANAKWPGAKEGKWPTVPIGKSKDLKRGQWVVAMGHPGGPKTDRPPPVRVGRFDQALPQESAIRTDCTLVGGDSGGPLYDLNGKLIGIHSRIGAFLEWNMHVPMEIFQDEWERLKKGDLIGKPSDVELGVVLDEESEAPTIKTVSENSPAAKAGLMVGDVIVKFNSMKVHTSDDLIQLLTGCEPGEVVNMEVQRGEKVVTLKVVLGRKSSRKPKGKN